MKIKLGYSTGVFWNYNIPLKKKIKYILDVSNQAIEIMFGHPSTLEKIPEKETIELIKKFKYRSIHAPVKNVYYSPSQNLALIDKLLAIAKKVDADTVLFHPIDIDNFEWLGKKVGSRIAFENMDNRKTFGKSIDDLKIIFQNIPHAKWVFDVNHLYTNNPSMDKAEEYYKALGDRLCHYHFSGYGGFHECISISKENIIFSGLRNLTVPIINEGGDKNMKEIIKDEHKYILSHLNS